MSCLLQVVSGGVASNQYVRARLDMVVKKNGLQLVCPPPRLCTDNGNHIFLPLLLVVKANSINTVLLCKLDSPMSEQVRVVLDNQYKKNCQTFITSYGLSAVLTLLQQLYRY